MSFMKYCVKPIYHRKIRKSEFRPKQLKKKFVDFTLSLMFAECQQIVLFHHKFSPQRLHECLEISFKQSSQGR